MYTDRERQIFAYRNGTRDTSGELSIRRSDPLAIDRRLMRASLENELEPLFEQIARAAEPADSSGQENPARDPLLIASILDRLIPAIRDVFEILPLDSNGLGLTDQESLDVFLAYMKFKADVKKNTETTPSTSLPLAGALGATANAEPPPSATPNIAGSNGTSGEPRPDPRSRWPGGSPLRSASPIASFSTPPATPKT